MDEEIVVRMHNRVSFNLKKKRKKKETLLFAITWMDLEDIMK